MMIMPTQETKPETAPKRNAQNWVTYLDNSADADLGREPPAFFPRAIKNLPHSIVI